MSNDVIARLAAANPLPTAGPPRHPEPLAVGTRQIVVAVALIAAVAVPAAAFAGKLGDLLGLSNEGTPVATSSLDLSKDTGLNEAMQQLAFPSAMHLLGNRNGVSFYAARSADGDYWFPGGLATVAIDRDGNRGSYWEPNVWMRHGTA